MAPTASTIASSHGLSSRAEISGGISHAYRQSDQDLSIYGKCTARQPHSLTHFPAVLSHGSLGINDARLARNDPVPGPLCQAMADLYLKKLEAERKALWATCRLKGLAKDTPERR